MALLPDRFKVVTATCCKAAGEIGTIYQAAGFDYVGQMLQGFRPLIYYAGRIISEGRRITRNGRHDRGGTRCSCSLHGHPLTRALDRPPSTLHEPATPSVGPSVRDAAKPDPDAEYEQRKIALSEAWRTNANAAPAPRVSPRPATYASLAAIEGARISSISSSSSLGIVVVIGRALAAGVKFTNRW
jgi:hypothetical protein